jgi:hypothetical protein
VVKRVFNVFTLFFFKRILRYKYLLFLESFILEGGEMAEWSNAAVSKTVVRLPANRGFESPSLRKDKANHPPSGGWFLFLA